MARILAPFDKKDQKWLEGRLRYSSEPSAKDRIIELAKKYEAQWVFEDLSQDMEMAADLRNFHTHHDTKLEGKIPAVQDRPIEVHNLSVRLTTLCEVVLLAEAGITIDKIKARMSETRRLERRLGTR